ncbi:glycerophosphodiester phosphodiesterase family protein, partial [Georgenia yuyongxinii]
VARLVAAARLGRRPRVPGPAGGAVCVQVPTRVRGLQIVTSRFLAAAHRHGLAVHVWTVDDPGEMRRLLDLGVDGIISDRPRVLRGVLTERGAWH